MAKIDKIQVGTTSYEINLPITATPEISSLIVTGNLTVEGTSNLSVVNIEDSINSLMTKGSLSIYCNTIYPNIIDGTGQTLTISASSLSANATYSLILSTPSISLQGQEVDLNYSQINAGGATSQIWFSGKLYLNDKEINAVSVIENSDDTVTLSITNF